MICDRCGERADERFAQETEAAKREREAYLARDFDSARVHHRVRINLLKIAQTIVERCGTRRWCS